MEQANEPTAITVSFRHLYDTAYRAYTGTSHSPEKRATNTLAEFEAMINEDLQTVPDSYQSKYIDKFTGYFVAWLHSKSRCVSSMIAGPSNFPVRRMQKYNKWEDNKYNEFMAWRKRITAALARSERKRTQGSELEQAVRNLESRQKAHEMMKAANAIIRKHKGGEACIAECMAIGFKEATIRELLSPKYSYECQGYQTWQLSNNNANIKRLEQRVKELQKKETAKQAIAEGADTPELVINGAIIRKDFTDDRLKVIFDGKPAVNVITALKSRGFRWSPYLKTWCRKLTDTAFKDAQTICKNELTAI